MFLYILGNNIALSLAEICSLFPVARIEELSGQIARVSGVTEDEVLRLYPRMGGTQKIIAIHDGMTEPTEMRTYLLETLPEGKITYGLSVYGKRENVLSRALEIKKRLKSANRSARCINKDANNPTTAAILHEKLLKNKSDLSVTYLPSGKYAGVTVCLQDIEAYTARDTGKSRSMTVGMLPPKLAQMMVNFAHADLGTKIYDPFVGFGTILLEAAHAGYTSLMGSDIQTELVEKSRGNIVDFLQKLGVMSYELGSHKQASDNRGLGTWNLELFTADATALSTTKQNLESTAIVTESYLGRLFTPGNTYEKNIIEEKKNLINIYEGFLGELRKLGFEGTLVVTVPFWQLSGGKRVIYLEEFFALTKKMGLSVKPLLPKEYEKMMTTRKTLTYSRNDQVVGREIYCIEFSKD